MKPFILTIFLFFFLVKNSSSNPIVTSIEDNWNEIKSMSGQFEQIDQEGNIFNGQFFFVKPFIDNIPLKSFQATNWKSNPKSGLKIFFLSVPN